MTENNKKKEYLNQYKKACAKLKNLEEQLESTRESKSTVQAVVISDMPRGTNQPDLSDYMVQVDNLLANIEKARLDCLKVKLSIEDKIVTMQDGTECDVLRKRYIELKEWENICVEIGYSWRQTHRIHSSALINFKMA